MSAENGLSSSLDSIATGLMTSGGPYGMIAGSLLESAKFTLGGLLKSAQQKEAEYYLSRTANELESTMDLNRFAFYTGLVSVDEFRANYEYLWSILLYSAQQAAPITPAQASRQISDRDYGGQFAQEWRDQFRDGPLREYADYPERWENGYRIPEWYWSWPDRARFLEVSSGGLERKLPTPESSAQVRTAATTRLPLGTTIAGLRLPSGTSTWAIYGVIGYLGYRILRAVF